MTPAIAVLALLAVLLVFLPAAVLVIRQVGTRLLGRGSADTPLDGADIEPLGALELAGFTSPAEIAALSPRERRFVAAAVAPRLTANGLPASEAPTAWNDRGALRTDREVPVGAFMLVCPACGAPLGAVADVAHYVGSCPACSRRVAARRRGSRVSLTAIETVKPAGRRPRPRG